MTFKELRNMLKRMDDEKLDQEVSVISYGMNDGVSTTDVEIGDWTTDEMYIGAYFDEGRKDAFRRAMNTVCGECGNTDGDQCDKCWVKRSWKEMNKKPYIAHMRIPASVWFKASDVDEAVKVAHKLMDRITKWTRRQGEDALIDDIMSNLLETELIELADDTNDNGVADYTLSESDVERIIG